MNEPLDSRPLQTVNRLRLVVFIPVFVAAVGILILAVKLSGRFNAIEEPPARDYPPNPAPRAGATGRPITPDATRPGNRPQVTAAKTGSSGVMIPKASVGASATATTEPGRPLPTAVVQLPATPLSAGGLAANAFGIVGRVVLRGTPPPEKEIPVEPNCGKLRGDKGLFTRFYVVGTNGGLADVFVVLKDFPASRFEPAANAVEIRQRGCEYLPYVSAAHVGQSIRVFNDDSAMHNVHPTPTVDGNKEINRAQLPNAAPLDFVFTKPELFLRFKCDVHPWMFAYVSVVEHPFFAVSAADGRFALLEPPAGSYTLQVFHRKAGEKLVPVTVRPGKRLVVSVTLDLADPDKHEATVTEE